MTSSKRPSTSTVERPSRVINSVAPIRICDNGGWTDTWFAEHGKVFNIGVYPYVEVQIEVYPRDSREDRIILYAENYAERDAIYAGDFNALGAAMVRAIKATNPLYQAISIYLSRQGLRIWEQPGDAEAWRRD